MLPKESIKTIDIKNLLDHNFFKKHNWKKSLVSQFIPNYILNQKLFLFIKKNQSKWQKALEESKKISSMLQKKSQNKNRVISSISIAQLVWILLIIKYKKAHAGWDIFFSISSKVIFYFNPLIKASMIQKNIYIDYIVFLKIIEKSLTKEKSKNEVLKKAFNTLKKSEYQSYLKGLNSYTSQDNFLNLKNISEFANHYFLSKIKKSISKNKSEITKDECTDFYDFFRLLCYHNFFCPTDARCQKQDPKEPGNLPCQLAESYTFLSSCCDTIDWFIAPHNPILYTFDVKENEKDFSYNNLKGKFKEMTLKIHEDIYNVKQEIKENRERKKIIIETFINNKKNENAEDIGKEAERIKEEIRYVLDDDKTIPPKQKNNNGIRCMLKIIIGIISLYTWSLL